MQGRFMSHPDYAHVGDIEDRVLEELGELIQAISKARRFGYSSKHPETGISNYEQVTFEMSDVCDRMAEYKRYLIGRTSVIPA